MKILVKILFDSEQEYSNYMSRVYGTQPGPASIVALPAPVPASQGDAELPEPIQEAKKTDLNQVPGVPEVKKCPECGTEIIGKKAHCSVRCYNKAWYRTKAGKEYLDKMKKIRKNDPVPMSRPEIQRGF